jgi:hypothetical protein
MIILSIRSEEEEEIRKIELTESSFHHLQRNMPSVPWIEGIRAAITEGRQKILNFTEITNGTGTIPHSDINKIHGYFFFCTRAIHHHDPLFTETFHLLRKFFQQALAEPKNNITFVRTKSLPTPRPAPAT